MLTKKQIKIMAKPYTNKRIIMLGTKLVTCSEWWGNGHIIFFEDPPTIKGYPKDWDTEDCVDATKDMKGTVDNLIAMAGVAVYPVEIRPNTTREYAGIDYLVVLRFSDGKGLDLWFNARYIAAIQKRHKQELTWKTPSAASGVLVAYSDGPVAVLMAMRPDGWDEEPVWDLKDEYIEEERCLKLM